MNGYSYVKRWSRVKSYENHTHFTKPPPLNVAVLLQMGSVSDHVLALAALAFPNLRLRGSPSDCLSRVTPRGDLTPLQLGVHSLMFPRHLPGRRGSS